MKELKGTICLALAAALVGCTAGTPVSSGGPVDTGMPVSSSMPGEVGEADMAPASRELEPDDDAVGAKVDFILPADVAAEAAGVTVKVDPLMEMLSVVMYLSEYDAQWGLLSDHRTAYHDDIESAFRDYAGHAAVQFFNKEMRMGFAFDSPPTACLYIEKDFAISNDYKGSEYDLNRMSADMQILRNVMESFFFETGFADFFESHKGFYQSMIDAYVEEFPEWNMIEGMERFYGKTMAGYNIVLVPLFHSGGFGPSLVREDGTHIYSITGPYGVENAIPWFGSAEGISELVIHEFGHSFIAINEEEDAAMQAEVARSAYLMDAVAQDMTSMAYPEWLTAYEELVLRGAVIDILVQNTGADPEPLLEYERGRGFLYIDTVYEALLQYDENRDSYPDFDAFVPVLTDALLEAYPKG